MIKSNIKLFSCLAIAGLSFVGTSCSKSHYAVENISGYTVPMDTHWAGLVNPSLSVIIDSYKSGLDSAMNISIGEAEVAMNVSRPQSLLSNLAADMVCQIADKYTDKPSDFGILNVGGIRTNLNKGTITLGEIFSIFPFENALSVITLKGSDVKNLFKSIANRKGEAVSHQIHLILTSDNQVSKLEVGGKPIDDNRLYRIATIDYLADGNDGMDAMKNAVERENLDILLRDATIEYIKDKTSRGEAVSSRLDDRIVYGQ